MTTGTLLHRAIRGSLFVFAIASMTAPVAFSGPPTKASPKGTKAPITGGITGSSRSPSSGPTPAASPVGRGSTESPLADQGAVASEPEVPAGRRALVPVSSGRPASGVAPLSKSGAPTITSVVPTRGGYRILGRGFGTSRGRVVVFENGRARGAGDVVSVRNDTVEVRSDASAPTRVAVAVDGARSAEMAYDPSGKGSLSSDMRSRGGASGKQSGAVSAGRAPSTERVRIGTGGEPSGKASNLPTKEIPTPWGTVLIYGNGDEPAEPLTRERFHDCAAAGGVTVCSSVTYETRQGTIARRFTKEALERSTNTDFTLEANKFGRSGVRGSMDVYAEAELLGHDDATSAAQEFVRGGTKLSDRDRLLLDVLIEQGLVPEGLRGTRNLDLRKVLDVGALWQLLGGEGPFPPKFGTELDQAKRGGPNALRTFLEEWGGMGRGKGPGLAPGFTTPGTVASVPGSGRSTGSAGPASPIGPGVRGDPSPHLPPMDAEFTGASSGPSQTGGGESAKGQEANDGGDGSSNSGGSERASGGGSSSGGSQQPSEGGGDGERGGGGGQPGGGSSSDGEATSQPTVTITHNSDGSFTATTTASDGTQTSEVFYEQEGGGFASDQGGETNSKPPEGTYETNEEGFFTWNEGSEDTGGSDGPSNEFTPDPDGGRGYVFKDDTEAFLQQIRAIQAGANAPGAGVIDCGPDGCVGEATSGAGGAAGRQGQDAIKGTDREGIARAVDSYGAQADYNQKNQGAIDYGPDHVGAGPPSQGGEAPQNETSGENVRRNESGYTGLP